MNQKYTIDQYKVPYERCSEKAETFKKLHKEFIISRDLNQLQNIKNLSNKTDELLKQDVFKWDRVRDFTLTMGDSCILQILEELFTQHRPKRQFEWTSLMRQILSRSYFTGAFQSFLEIILYFCIKNNCTGVIRTILSCGNELIYSAISGSKLTGFMINGTPYVGEAIFNHYYILEISNLYSVLRYYANDLTFDEFFSHCSRTNELAKTTYNNDIAEEFGIYSTGRSVFSEGRRYVFLLSNHYDESTLYGIYLLAGRVSLVQKIVKFEKFQQYRESNEKFHIFAEIARVLPLITRNEISAIFFNILKPFILTFQFEGATDHMEKHCHQIFATLTKSLILLGEYKLVSSIIGDTNLIMKRCYYPQILREALTDTSSLKANQLFYWDWLIWYRWSACPGRKYIPTCKIAFKAHVNAVHYQVLHGLFRNLPAELARVILEFQLPWLRDKPHFKMVSGYDLGFTPESRSKYLKI